MSLSGHLAGAAASQAVRGAGQQVGQAIGKPLDGLSSATSSRHPGHSDINWVDFNYPPGLRLIHYSSDELPSSLSGLVRCMNISFVVTCVACALNLIDTLVVHFGSGTKTPGRWLLQSLIHLLLLPMAAGGVFYSGYRGLAEPDSTLYSRFRVGQVVLALVYFLFAVIPSGCVNGFFMLGQVRQYAPEGHGYWMFAIIAESLLWMGNCALACLNVFRTERYDAHGTRSKADSRF
ncbi:unnamed protein product [Prorocentrum cordatum]|uniref:Uncharacterized protein n=1 Tax=Prorocentrum cordatum TaxID=2364126 RepID=A0ABN9S0E0_9DINO|nr:unnamed protein product [Polarella glacialis]